ncbi:hypothetical protein AURDEDRAFT_162535 [Auricularia subglabra TFB-10046 SS5]|nr:hypothetical protein AURDEDRAFT_162535 [Auricularia subglabra TFB-10046 SS5]
MSEKVAPAQVAKQAEAGGALTKLLVFSVALAVVPVGSYFLSINYVYNGNATYAAITAVVAANLVFAAFIVAAVSEDRAERNALKAQKSQ